MSDQPPPLPTEPEPSPAAPPGAWLWRVLITLAALTGAGNYLLYSRGPGAGWAVFFLLLAAGIFANRRSAGMVRGAELVLAGLLAASAVQMVVRPSLSNALVLSALTLVASAHFVHAGGVALPAARKLVEGVRCLLLAPVRWLEATRLLAVDGVARGAGLAREVAPPRRLVRLGRIVVPAALVVLPFAVLLGSGNGVLGRLVTTALGDLLAALTDIRPPSPARVFFLAAVATAVLGLLWRSRPSVLFDRLASRLAQLAPGEPGDLGVSRWRTLLILVGVNVLFFVSNTIDLTFLGGGLELPRGVTYSQFVHEGTHSLIASALTAGAVLSVLFQQHRSVTGWRPVRALALLWVAQNVVLLANVARRVAIYVGEYHLTVLRLHLLLFLGLVCAGFGLLVVRIARDKSLGWLVRANLAAVFALFASIQFWDTRASVARYNLTAAERDPAKALDVGYLQRLGPSAWPTLRDATENPQLSAAARQGAREALDEIAHWERARAAREDWRDFRWKRAHLRRSLLAVAE